jgi:hypothetical protein
MQPRTSRHVSDRGRYPEEAVEEDIHREDTPSDDGEGDDALFAFLPSGHESINIGKPSTPGNSVSVDDLNMYISDAGGAAMDIDTVRGSRFVC